MNRVRNFVFTLNNWTNEEYEHLEQLDIFKYIVIGKEVGENGTPHLQGYAELIKQTTFNKIKKLIPRAHIEARRGTSKEASDYCKKDNDFFEKGEISNQGCRSDLEGIKEQILKNEISIDEIIKDNPMMYHKYGRTLDKIENLKNQNVYRTDMTECDWITGVSGSGKSHMAFKNFTPETHYLYKEDKGWWDNYKGQEVVIINDFKGEIKYSTLLQLIDKWPFEVPRRNRSPVPFVSKKIIITSIMLPHEVYHNLHESDGIDQLLRRVNIIKLDNVYVPPEECSEVKSTQKLFPIFKKYSKV